MAFPALILNGKSILALVVAESTRLAIFHVSHTGLEDTGFEGEDLGVAVGALVSFEVEVVAELHFAAVVLEGDRAGLEPFVALVALACYGECLFAVVAGAAGFPLLHVGHGVVLRPCLEDEELGVAILAAERLGVEAVAEGYVADSLDLEGDLARLHPLVAVAAVADDGEGPLAVVAGAAGLPFFHLRHGGAAILAGDHGGVVACLALPLEFGEVVGVAEDGLACAFHLVLDVARLALVAVDAVLVVSYAKCLDACVAGAAGLGLFHLSHGKVTTRLQIEDRVVTDLAIVVIFFQVYIMAEGNCIGIFERELDVLRLQRKQCDRRCAYDEKRQDGKAKLHGTLLLTGYICFADQDISRDNIHIQWAIVNSKLFTDFYVVPAVNPVWKEKK